MWGPLDVHHRTYAHLGDERPWELVAGCEPCHARLHDRLRRRADDSGRSRRSGDGMTPEARQRGVLGGALLLLPGRRLAGPGQWALRRWDLPRWPAALPAFVLLFGGAGSGYLAGGAR